MSAPRTGGPAFPRVPVQWGNGDTVWSEPGMTLRDYFAAKAMQGWLSSFTTDDGDPIPAPIARLAYEIADAMLAARKGGAA